MSQVGKEKDGNYNIGLLNTQIQNIAIVGENRSRALLCSKRRPKNNCREKDRDKLKEEGD
jgi:hypothetical protein